ncbi:hypothetical protein [Frankia sp. AvcI1]|uniref:hypothetical protein n=1 Tax=Frankia sp. AvcI1 TaxID=573496 RepID=UPI002118E42E|nr:hypothetical protein [Frankia sp. AvcI1]
MDTTLPIEVAPQFARAAGFRHRVIITAAAWNATVAWSDLDTEQTGALQDEVGREMDVLTMAAAAVRAAERAGQRGVLDAPFTVRRIPRGVPYLGDDDEDGAYEALTVVGMYVIVGGTPTTVTISLDDE